MDVPPDQWEYIDVPAIIPEDLWEAANGRLEKGKTNSGRRERSYVLSSLLVCPGCGRKLSGRNNQRYQNKKYDRKVYFCRHSKKGFAPIGPTCSMTTNYLSTDIEQAVIEALGHTALRQDFIERAYQKYIAMITPLMIAKLAVWKGNCNRWKGRRQWRLISRWKPKWKAAPVPPIMLY